MEKSALAKTIQNPIQEALQTAKETIGFYADGSNTELAKQAGEAWRKLDNLQIEFQKIKQK